MGPPSERKPSAKIGTLLMGCSVVATSKFLVTKLPSDPYRAPQIRFNVNDVPASTPTSAHAGTRSDDFARFTDATTTW